MAGFFFVIFSFRIPINGLIAHNGMLVPNLIAFAVFALLTLPLMLSLKVGAALQILVQLSVLFGPYHFGSSYFSIPQIVATLLILWCMGRLMGVGPPMRTLREAFGRGRG